MNKRKKIGFFFYVSQLDNYIQGLSGNIYLVWYSNCINGWDPDLIVYTIRRVKIYQTD